MVRLILTKFVMIATRLMEMDALELVKFNQDIIAQANHRFVFIKILDIG